MIPCARVRCIHRKSYDVLPATGSSRFPPWLPRQRLKNRKRAGGGTGGYDEEGGGGNEQIFSSRGDLAEEEYFLKFSKRISIL